MANYSTLRSAIQSAVKQNGNNEITGNLLQQSLLSMINSLGTGFQFMGVAIPSTNPGTPDQNVFYIAATAGTYSNFGNIVLSDNEVAILKGSGSSWTKETANIATASAVRELRQQKIKITACVSQPNFVAEGEYFYHIAENKLALKDAGVWTWTPINDVSHIIAFYDGQIATYNGEKLISDADAYDKLSRITPNDLEYQNKQVNAQTGELGLYNAARLCSEMFVSMGFEIEIANGYYMYLYMYDINGNYLGYNETNNSGKFVFAFPFACKMRLVFKHTDGTSPISSISGVIDSCTGIFNYSIGTNKIKDNAVTLPKIDKSPATFDDIPRSGSDKLIDSDAVYSAINYNIDEASNSGVFSIENKSAILPACNIMRANNVFNYSTYVQNRIRNDSGTEITDYTSAYLSQKVPAFGGCFLKSSVAIQRIYYLAADGSWIGRTPSMAEMKYHVPATFNGQTIYYVQFQFQTANIANNVVITWGKASYMDIGAGNNEFNTNSNGELYDNTVNLVWKSDFGNIDYYSFLPKEEIDNSGDLITDISPWEPSSADSGYSNPETGSGRDTYRSAWTATDKYKYYDFLEHYYDGYLGESSEYKVTKRMLWQSGQCNGHEVYEYDFCPLNYKYIIMLSAGMNANETQGIWGLATLIRCLMNEEEPVLASIKGKVRFKVIPIINAAGFDYDSPLKYGYVESREVSTEVNPNFNFNYKTSWEDNTATWSYKGPYPDSCVETQGLKNWINEYSGKAIFWADLHTGRWPDEYPNKQILDIRFGSLSSYYSDFNSIHVPLIKQFYINKGFVTAGDNIGAAIDVRNNVDYQKHRYAVDICEIESCMPEMHIESTGYGTNGQVNNDPLGIKAYVLQIRQLVIYALNKYITTHMISSLPKQNINNLQNRF